MCVVTILLLTCTLYLYVLLYCRYFHVTSGLPPDVMHDVLEGAIHVELKCLLTTLIQEQKLFRFSVLNDRIDCFPYGDDVSDKPKPLHDSFFSTGSIKLGGKPIEFAIKINNIEDFFSFSK